VGLNEAPSRTGAPDPDAGEHGPLLAIALARAIVAVVAFCGFGGVALLWVLDLGHSAGEVALAVALLTALLGLLYFYFARPSTDLHRPRAYAALAAQACLVYLPLPLYGPAWVSQPPFLAAGVLLVLPAPAAWPVFAGIVAGTAVAQYFASGVWLDVVYVLVNSATAGLFVYGLVRLARLVTVLHRARDELAKTAVAEERLRFARNLHDLLELSLSAIAPKAELAGRLLRRNPVRAGQELTEIQGVARRALADLRSIARLYRETSLDGETETLASMLAASDVELRVDLDRRELPPPTRAALAAILREGVAFMLRHREAAHCEIVLRQAADRVMVDIVTDEVDEIDGATSVGERGGFADLSATVSRMAGELTAGMDADGRPRLQVRLPLTTRPAEGLTDAAGELRESIPSVATKLAGWLVTAVCCGLFLQAVLRLLEVTHEFWEVALGMASMLSALVLQLAYFSRPGARLRTTTGYLLLGLQALLVYLPWLQAEPTWTGLPGFVAGSALLVLRPALGWSVFAAVVASIAWTKIEYGTSALSDYGQILVTLDMGLIIYGLTWMARSVRQLRATRRRLADAALATTRLRFAQDLHDLLGLSLSAITLKTELAHRLVPRDPARARAVLAELLEICRQALADVRSVAGGYHQMSLEEECRTAKALLATAGMNVRMDIDHGDLPADTGTALATVLREGVTNVLRHSKGERCELTIHEDANGVYLCILNDGPIELADGDHRGTGIRNMSDRVTALGGSLTAGSDGDGRFLLRADIPKPITRPPATTS
jgi:signal transduction histidine kinase